MEQKMKQKRMISGMIQASDIRSDSAKLRNGSANRKELHGKKYYFLITAYSLFTYIYSI